MGGDREFAGNKGLCVDQSIRISMNSGLGICGGETAQDKFMKNKVVVFRLVLLSLAVLIILVSYFKYKHNAEADPEKRLGGMDPKWTIESFH